MSSEEVVPMETDGEGGEPNVDPTTSDNKSGDAREVNEAEKDLEAAQDKLNLQALPIRAYLDQTVVPLLLDGMSALVKVITLLYILSDYISQNLFTKCMIT